MSETIVKDLKADISMPKNIVIGDVMYLEEYDENTKYVFVKGYRGKSNWVGKLNLICEEDEDGYQNYILKGTYGSTEEMANLFAEGSYYKGMRLVETPIGLDTATMHIGIDDRGDDFRTSTDGFMGSVYEIKNDNKLEGIHFDLLVDAGGNYSFETVKEKVEYVFNCKLV